MNSAAFVQNLNSFLDQRSYIDVAMASLGNNVLVPLIESEFAGRTALLRVEWTGGRRRVNDDLLCAVVCGVYTFVRGYVWGVHFCVRLCVGCTLLCAVVCGVYIFNLVCVCARPPVWECSS